MSKKRSMPGGLYLARETGFNGGAAVSLKFEVEGSR
jgi:hypothetical protein